MSDDKDQRVIYRISVTFYDGKEWLAVYAAIEKLLAEMGEIGTLSACVDMEW